MLQRALHISPQLIRSGPSRPGVQDGGICLRVFRFRVMKRNNTKLNWTLLGSLAGAAACVGALYKTVRNRIERKFDEHFQEVAIQTFESEGGPALD
jgi:hypothetical protein